MVVFCSISRSSPLLDIFKGNFIFFQERIPDRCWIFKDWLDHCWVESRFDFGGTVMEVKPQEAQYFTCMPYITFRSWCNYSTFLLKSRIHISEIINYRRLLYQGCFKGVYKYHDCTGQTYDSCKHVNTITAIKKQKPSKQTIIQTRSIRRTQTQSRIWPLTWRCDIGDFWSYVKKA